MPRLLQPLFLALLALAIGSALWQHPRLPERVATHFDGQGHANGWLLREQHTALQIGTLLFMAALIQGIIALNRRLPKELINVPHRDYWFAPERAASSHQTIAIAVRQIGCALLAFFTVLFHLVYRANLSPAPHLDATIWWATAALLGVVATVLGRLFLCFWRLPAA